MSSKAKINSDLVDKNINSKNKFEEENQQKLMRCANNHIFAKYTNISAKIYQECDKCKSLIIKDQD